MSKVCDECGEPATHYACLPAPETPVCAEHACSYCNQPEGAPPLDLKWVVDFELAGDRFHSGRETLAPEAEALAKRLVAMGFENVYLREVANGGRINFSALSKMTEGDAAALYDGLHETFTGRKST